MGQKIHPYSLRLGIIRNWQSHWIGKNKKDLRKNIKEDFAIRGYIRKKLSEAMVEKVLINRNTNTVSVDVYVARPGVVIGHKGEGIDKLKKAIERKIDLGKSKKDERKKIFRLNIKGIDGPDINAVVVAKNITNALEKRIPFRRVAKQSLDRVSQNKMVKGVKIQLSGRLDGAEMARKEFFNNGSIPLQTLRADVDFARETARTTYGAIGIKVWIYKGEIFNKK